MFRRLRTAPDRSRLSVRVPPCSHRLLPRAPRIGNRSRKVERDAASGPSIGNERTKVLDGHEAIPEIRESRGGVRRLYLDVKTTNPRLQMVVDFAEGRDDR